MTVYGAGKKTEGGGNTNRGLTVYGQTKGSGSASTAGGDMDFLGLNPLPETKSEKVEQVSTSATASPPVARPTFSGLVQSSLLDIAQHGITDYDGRVRQKKQAEEERLQGEALARGQRLQAEALAREEKKKNSPIRRAAGVLGTAVVTTVAANTPTGQAAQEAGLGVAEQVGAVLADASMTLLKSIIQSRVQNKKG